MRTRAPRPVWGARCLVAVGALALVWLYVNDGMWHVPIGDGTGVPELQQAYDAMIAFFKRHLGI